MEADVPVVKQNDWETLVAGIPSTAGVVDPEARRVLDALIGVVRYLLKKAESIHEHDEMVLTDVTQRNRVHGGR